MIVPVRNETKAARTGLSSQCASGALMPNCSGSAAPAANAKRRYGHTTVRSVFVAVCSFPCQRPGRFDAQLRRDRPAGPAVPTDDRADEARRAALVRIRLDVRFAHPLRAVVRDASAGCFPNEQDQAWTLRGEYG